MKDLISRYHREDITERIARAFKRRSASVFSCSSWEVVNHLLNTRQNFTIGLFGDLGLSFGEIDARFRKLCLIDRLTNPKLYTVMHNIPDDISIIGIGTDSVLYAGFGSITERYVNDQERGGEPLGIHIKYGKNRGFQDQTGNYEREFVLSGQIRRGFVLSHETGQISSIDVKKTG